MRVCLCVCVCVYVCVRVCVCILLSMTGCGTLCRTSASAWTLSSPTPSEFSTRPTSPISPLQGQRSEVVFPGTAPAIGGGATVVPLSKPPPLQLGDLHARMSSRRTLGVEAPLPTSARRHHGVRNQSMLEAMYDPPSPSVTFPCKLVLFHNSGVTQKGRRRG
jgi:hypothetical protein